MAIRPPSNLLLFVNNCILLFFVSDENPPEVSGCLHQIYPKLASQLDYFRVVERCLTLFRHFVGVRMSNKMGPTSFRMMARYGGVFLFSKWKLSTMVIIPWYKLYSQDIATYVSGLLAATVRFQVAGWLQVVGGNWTARTFSGFLFLWILPGVMLVIAKGDPVQAVKSILTAAFPQLHVTVVAIRVYIKYKWQELKTNTLM